MILIVLLVNTNGEPIKTAVDTDITVLAGLNQLQVEYRSEIAALKSELESVFLKSLSQMQEKHESQISTLRSELEATRGALAKLYKALTGDDNLTMDDGDHVITRRSADDSEADNSEDILSSLSLTDMLSLSKCRDGQPGTAGKDGKDGAAGVQGLAGRDGRDGMPGTPGEDGSPGMKGADGDAGSPGTAGSPGAVGPAGVQGAAGEPGAPGNQSGIGSVYTRWGRTTCDGNAELLYQGFAGGGHYGNTGNGVNYQCLHPDPQYNNFHSGGSFSIISGAEYESYSYGLYPDNAYQQNVPCARCYTSRSAVVMIPARRTCNSGWTKEYEGYLMSSYHGHAQPKTYECMDGSPEYISGHHANTNGALFYFVIPDCESTGTIGHCPPYDTNKQLTCVVCSK